MISSAIVKEQLDAYLDKLIPPRKQRGKVRETSRIDPDALAKLVEDHMKKLRDLVDSECKKMFVDYARDVSMTLDGVLRCFINFCQNPEGGIDTEKIGSSYGNLREMFMEKYRSFFSSEFEEADSVFFSLSATLEEMKAESLSLHQRLASSIIAQPEINKNSTKTETTSTKETTPAPSLQPEKKADSSQKSDGGWISRLMNRFKPSGEAYVKCNTGKDSSGMRYDPVKKRWFFDDDPQDEQEEEKVKAPPKAKDIEERKEQAEKQKAQEGQELDGEKKEKSIVDNLLKPRGRNADRMKGKTKAPGGGPKLPKVTAMMFDEINAQAPNFTIDQQRELIVFELKEQIRSITSEAYNQEEDAAKASKELELHTEEIKLHISNFLDQTLTRIYSQFKVMSNNFEDSMNDSVMNLNQSVLKPRIKTTISQGVQTTGIDASYGTRETTEFLSEKEKLIKTQKVLDEERQHLLRTNQKLNDLVQSLLKQLYHGQAGPSLPEEPSKAEACGFSESELKKVFGTVSDLVASVNQLRGQLNQAVIERAKLVKTVRVLMMENEKKGNFIVQMQKKFKERKSMLYTAMKQSEVMSKEKEILKGVAKAFYEESSHYQDECGRLSLQNVQMRLSMEEEIAANKASIEQMERFMEALLAKFSKEVMHDRERETQIAASFTKLRSMYAGRLEEQRQVMRDACMRYDSLSNFVESSIRSYENEFRYLHEQLELRTDQHRELSAKVKTLSTKITHEISHSAKLEEELRDTRRLLKIKEEEADQAKDELEALEKELSSKREELALLLVDSDSRNKEHKEMIQEVYDSIAAERQEILAGLNHVLQGAGLVMLEDAIPEAMIGSTKTIKEHIAALISQNHELSVKTAQETEELKAKLDLKIEQLQGQLEESKVVIDTLTESARMQSHIVIERQKTSSDTELSLISEVSTLQTQLDETRKHLQAKDEASITLLEDLNTKKEEIKKLEGYLETWQEQVHQLTKELTDKQKTIDELEAEKLRREQRAEPEDSQNVPKDVDKDETSSQNEEFSAELEKLKMELKAEREAKEEAIHEVSRQKGYLEFSSQDRDYLQQQIDHLKAQVQENEGKMFALEQENSRLVDKISAGESPEPATSQEKVNGASLHHSDASPSEKAEEPQVPGLKEMHEHMEMQNRRIELLLMDLEEANRSIAEYKLEREDLKARVLGELREVAESNKEAKDLLNTLFREMQK